MPAHTQYATPRQLRNRRPHDREDYYDDDLPRRTRRKRQTGSNTGLIIGLIAGGVGLLIIIIVVVVLIVVLNSSSPRQLIVGRWQPIGAAHALGIESYEFTSDGRFLARIKGWNRKPVQDLR